MNRYIIMLVIVSMLSIGCTTLYTDQSRRLEKIESRIESVQRCIEINREQRINTLDYY